MKIRALLYVMGAWSATGFMFGAMNTLMERDTVFGTRQAKSGCIYRSVAPLLNPGYVLACELFRVRFEYEGVDKMVESEFTTKSKASVSPGR